MKENFDLDKPLIEFKCKQGTLRWTIRSAVEGVQIFGGIGSGKTSGSGRLLALKYLSNGFGGLVLTAKRDERKLWEDYCRLTNRTDDLIVIEPGGKNYFNFLEYESSTQPDGLSITANIAQVLKTVIRAGEEKGKGKTDDEFWQTSLDMLVNNVIDLCMLAYDKVSVQQIYDIVNTAPKKDDTKGQSQSKKTPFRLAIEAAQKKVNTKVDTWEGSLSEEDRDHLRNNPEMYEGAILNEFADARTLKSLDQFFADTYYSLGEKTRTIIELIFSGFLFHLLKEPIFSLFCRYPSNIQPEACLDGKIILIDLPVKIFQKAGRDCQILFKYIFQRSMEKRRIEVNERPVFIWADEAQHFLHEHDAEFQATARSSRIATVYISQNLPNYYASMGGEQSSHRVKSFLGTLSSKFFHSNADVESNRYASELIGKGYTRDDSFNDTYGGSGGPTYSEGNRFILEDMVRPEEFSQLKNGGPRNNYMVEAYMHIIGTPFPNGFNHKKVQFNQNYTP